ncbi:MAG TPA: MrtZ family glutamic-type intramembrane protease [Nannocystaceae bacterium]|nr:MrtZ family glutamic-type intramembrane protease [Nannocystaceae bacterium]
MPPRPELARIALLVTAGVYGTYAILGAVGVPADLRYLALVAAFYLLPAMVLRRDPERAARWQVGPDGVIPKLSRRGLAWAAITIVIVFPPFILACFWFYAQVCRGDYQLLAPVMWIEGLTPAAGGLERYLQRFCVGWEGALFPSDLRWPADWESLALPGLGKVHVGVVVGTIFVAAIEVFAIALPEEVFHRGFLMSALEERFPPTRRVLGARLGLGAVLASLIFALGHLIGMAELARLATFFPSLLFSYLWRRSGSLWAPALFHAAANLLMAVLLASTFPR